MKHMTLTTAVFTPFDENGRLLLDRVEAQADAVAGWGSPAVFVAGTAGEGASLTTAERKQLAERWCEVASGRLDVIVHVGHTSLGEARALAEHAQEIGAQAIASVAPYFHRPANVSALTGFCAEIASAAPELPFTYYHIPGATGVSLRASDVLLSARERIPTFAGIKYADGDLADLHRCLRLAEDKNEIWIGNAKVLLAAISLGARVAIGSVYNFAAPLYTRMLDHLERGDLQAARECQFLAQTVVETAARYGGELSGFKAMGKLVGVDCGPCRSPLQSPDEQDLRQLRGELVELGFMGAAA